MTETRLAMAERHVREGADRITRQQALITTLIRDGHNGMLPQAHDLLAQLEGVQAMSKEHLARYQAEAASGSR